MSPVKNRIAASAALVAAAAAGTALLRAGPAAAQTDMGSAAFVARMQAIERQRVEALVRGEAAVTARLTADDYHLIGPYGTIDDKAAEIRSAGKGFYLALTPGPIAVRRAGPDAAILRYRLAAAVRLHGGRYDANYWHTDYYERRHGQWQVVWSQSTEIKPPAPRPAPTPEASFDTDLRLRPAPTQDARK
ncbi:MAG TPA: nuclear transport factor 2 family protein [Allosphingosinicella sp.]|nr:nuclear transport factor 2 family protein [Allosphingosinicella sp.]